MEVAAVSEDASATVADGAALAQLLDRFAHVAAASHDAREMTDWLLRRLAELTGWPVAHAYLVDPHGAVTTWLSARTNETGWEAYLLAADGLAMRTPTGLIDRVMATRRPGWVSDIGIEADYPRAAAARAAGLRGVFALPVVRGNEVVSLLQFLSPRPIEPDNEFLDGMTIAGFLLGTAFTQLQLRGESVDKPSRLHRIVDAGNRAFIPVDAEGRVASWTRGAERLFGWTRAEAMYRRSDDLLLSAEHRTEQPPADNLDGADRLIWTNAITARRRDGSTFPAEVTHWAVPGAAIYHYLFVRDVSEREQRAAGIARDPLTGLMNRAGMLEAVAGRLAYGSDARSSVLLLVGLQRFKEIDYSQDHHVADEALRIIGTRLEAFAERAQRELVDASAVSQPEPEAPAVARVAGDEFAILLDGSGGASAIARLAAQAADVVAEPLQAADRRLALTAHVGAAEPLAGSDARSWFGDAESALYRSRYAGGAMHGSHAHFEIEGFARRRGSSWRHSLPDEMQGALRGGQFELYYQPIFRVPDRVLAGAEALIRWHHPQHGLLLPGEFIDAAEESGMIAPIGEWVLQTAARQLGNWAGAGLSVAVNLSARQLAEPGIVAQVARAVREVNASAPGSTLVVEVTESVLMADPAVAATRIGQFRDAGVQVAIDDFGTGYSSLSYLKWFDVEVIKIDMSFVHGLGTSRTDAAIVRSIIDLALELDLRVIAEGVETDEQFELLAQMGATYVQGFGIGRPGPAAGITALIQHPADARPAAN
jgi:PAS domain S-box-containing protein/diguanylate cyclase (GGDEF)-like protein